MGEDGKMVHLRPLFTSLTGQMKNNRKKIRNFAA